MNFQSDMMKPSRGADQFMQTLQKNEENRQQKFIDKMKDFPCSFNLGCSDLNIGEKQYTGCTLSKPDLRMHNEYLKINLEDSDSEYYEDTIWKNNLLTLVHAELKNLPAALRLNNQVLKRSGNQNLVALGNAAFLFYLKKDVEKADCIIVKLNKLKATSEFENMKVKAILEQAYEYRKFGGAKYLLCSMALFDFALPNMHPTDERLQFMRAMVYRRCTHFQIYCEDPENIHRSRFALVAAQELVRLGNNAEESAIKSAALIELAYLKHNDDARGRSSSYEQNVILLDRQTWAKITGRDDWETLCLRALEAGEDNLTEKVLKIAGQLFRYSHTNNNYLHLSVKYLKAAIKKRPTNRAHHHLGLTYRKMAINYERAQRKGSQRHQQPNHNENINTIKHLPQPPESKKPLNLEARLKCALKIPREGIQFFSENNPYSIEAVKQFNQAVKLSGKLNIPATYDLGYIYVQMDSLRKAKQTCLSLIEVSNNSCSGLHDATYVVSAYNLYGMCCAMEAEKTEDETKKEDLVDESEEMLINAVRMASHLAADTPELATCATDLWYAFSTLKKKFIFEGSADSKKKMFKLCELIHDYRYLEEVDKIFSRDPSEWQNLEALERCLERYLNMKDIDGALLFLDMISLRPETNLRFKRLNSPNVQKIMFEAAKRTLYRFLTPNIMLDEDSIILPDQIWKNMFQERFDTNNNSRKYEVVIVQDIDDHEPDSGMKCDNTCRYLKDILVKICGLNVVRHHEVGLAGALQLEEDITIISESHVTIFVFSNPESVSTSLESHLERALTFHEEAEHESDTGITNTEVFNLTPPYNPHFVSNHDNARRETFGPENLANSSTAQPPISNLLKFVISTCTQMKVEKTKPNHIVGIYLDGIQAEVLSVVLEGLPKLNLTDTEINLLSLNSPDHIDKTVDLILNIFKSVVCV